MSDSRTVTLLEWFLDAPYADVMLALTEDGSLLDDVRRTIVALRDRDPLLTIAHERLVTVEQRHAALVAALDGLVDEYHEDWGSQLVRARLATLLRQHREGLTPIAPGGDVM